MYTDLLLDHFLNPRNVGELPDADGVGAVGSLECVIIWKLRSKLPMGK